MKLLIAYNYSCIVALKDFSFIVKTHRKFASLLISLHRLSTCTSKAKCVYKVYNYEFGRNSTITLIEQSLHEKCPYLKLLNADRFPVRLPLILVT